MNLLFKFVCISYILASCSARQSIKYLTDLEQDNIKGHVARLVTETFNVDSLGHAAELELVSIEIFDKRGYTTTDTIKDFLEKKEVVNFLAYNKNGSLSSISTFGNGKKQSKTLLKYDDDKCTAMKIYDANDNLESYYGNIQQTNFGLLASLNGYDANGKLTMSYVNEYDSIYQIGAVAKDNKGRVGSEVKIKLTDKKYQGNVLEVTYFKDSTVKKYFSYNYENWDTAGNWIRQTVLDEAGKTVKIVNRIFSYE